MLLKAAQWCKIALNSYFHVLDLISIGVLFKRTAWNSKIRLLRRLSQENHYQTFFSGHPVPSLNCNFAINILSKGLIKDWLFRRRKNIFCKCLKFSWSLEQIIEKEFPVEAYKNVINLIFSLFEVRQCRVSRCQMFNTEHISQTKFYPKKGA